MGLTEVRVRYAKPGEKPVKLYDGAGLFLEVSPSGGKWWRLKYRVGKKEKRLSLGVYPGVSLKEARDRRDEARRLLNSGIDPSVDRQTKRTTHASESANSFEAVAREWLERYSTNWSPGHAERVIRRFDRDIFPWIGDRPAANLSAPELLSAVRRIESRGVGETAKRALISCGQVMRYAVATGRAERDPSADLRGSLSPIKSEHFAATTDPKGVGEILLAIDGYKGILTVSSALKLMPLVFVRPGELRKAEWSDFDLEAAEWRYVVTKTKTPHIVPLSRQAVEILERLRPVTSRCRYDFPSARSGVRPMSDNAILAAMRNLGIEKSAMTGHGFRAVARALLDEVLGFRPDYIEHQLAHAVRDPNGRAYNRTAFLSERRAMMQRWADYLSELKLESARGKASY